MLKNILMLTLTKKARTHKSIMNSLLRKKDLSSPMSEFLSTIVLVVVMWFGGQLVLNDALNARIYRLHSYFSQIIPPAKSLTTAYYRIQKEVPQRRRVYEIKDLKESITNILKPKSITKLNDSIKFNNVYFSYENIEILKDINFKINKGETIALVGKSAVENLQSLIYFLDIMT